jgi:hypothetical protein
LPVRNATPPGHLNWPNLSWTVPYSSANADGPRSLTRGAIDDWKSNVHDAGERPPSGSRNHVALNSRGVEYSRVECERAALWCRLSVELLGESDEKPFRPADIAEPIRVFVLDNFAHELRAALAEPLERLVDAVHSEHDA